MKLSIPATTFALSLTVVLAGCPAGDDGTGTEETTGDSTETSATGDGDGDPATGDGDGDTMMMIDCEVDAWDPDADVMWQSAWMATCMVPAVAPIMQGIDAEKYENFSCTHCHGDDLGGGTFEMPASIALDWATAAEWPPEYFDGNTFMGPMSDVVGAAADALGVEPFDPMTMTGFGCGGCHPGL